jgi:predicted ATP-dependent serine protease
MLGGVENRTAVSPVFVGRRQELAGLTDALERACGGEPQALLVGGEAGVGKTRLLEEFLVAARSADAVTAVGGCLELGADGRSNRQIAESLYISPKTASVHVSNILAKLGMAGRTEAAATAHRLRLVEPAGTRVTG